MANPAARPGVHPAQIHRQILSVAVRKMLRSLVRMLLRSGIPYGLFADLAKQAYVEIASQEFEIPGRKQTVSRVAVITGLTRKEVARIKELVDVDAAEIVDRYNRAARVITGWVRDAKFIDEQGGPVPLPVEGEAPTFSGLVKEFSGDVPARAILDELVNVGAVERMQDGRIRLLTRAYVPRDSKADKLSILGTDVKQLIDTIDHNVHQEGSEPRFQRKVQYDNLPEEALGGLRAMSAEQAQVLLEKIDRWMAAHDRDTSPDVKGSGRKRAGVGIYYFEEDYEADDLP